MSSSNLFSSIQSLSADGKIIALRSIANSAIFRLFGAADRVSKLRIAMDQRLDPKASHGSEAAAYEEAMRAANDLASIWATLDAKIASVSSDTWSRPMQPEKVIDLLITPNPLDNDKSIRALAQALGEDPEQLIKLRDAALVAKAQQNRKAAERSGGDFEAIALGGTIEEVEYVLDVFESITQNAGGQIVLKKLRASYDQKLAFALTSSSGSGFSELFLLKDDIRIMQNAVNFDL